MDVRQRLRSTITLACLLLVLACAAGAEIPDGYYAHVDTSSADRLRATVHAVIRSGHVKIPYTAANDRCEALLQYWAEPLLAAGYLLTGRHDSAFVWQAWKQLLQNQPHDSICGCSVDQTHTDMLFRYDQCRLLAERIIDTESRQLAARQAAPCAAAGALAVHIHTGAGPPVGATTLVEIPLPHPRPEHFDLIAPDGQSLPWQLVTEHKPGPEYEFGWGQIPRFPAKARITIAAPLAIPACGMAAYHVIPRSAPAAGGKTLANGPAALANELIEVTVEPDGGLTLRDRRTGKIYRGLLRFEDCGDVGDGWTYRAPATDERVLSGPVKVTALGAGPLYAALRLETTLNIPCSAAADRRSRSTARTDVQIVSTVAILQGDPALHIETVVDNPARDHKLRVLFPTDIAAQTWSSDSPFDLTERPIAVQLTPGWDEPAQEIWWQQSLCTVSNGQDGLAIIAPECKESACVDDSRRTLALSLFRAFGQTVGTAGEDGPQRLGRSLYRYQVVPYQGDPAAAALLNRSARMRAGLRALVLPPHDGDLPAVQGLVAIAPAGLVLTALKKWEEGDGVIVRFFNPGADPVPATVTFPTGLSAAWRANLREQTGEALPVSAGNSVRLTVRGKEIVTLALQPG
jgi:alpha-mannosidase